MITINIMTVFKSISLMFLGILMLIYMLSTFSPKNEKISFMSMFIAFLFMATPFIYIVLN